MFLSVSISLRCEIIETKEDAFFRQMTLRQRYIATYEACSRSTVQTIFEIAALKAAYEATHTAHLSRAELADLWVRKTYDLSDSDEAPKTAFELVDSAMKIYDRMLSDNDLFLKVHSLELKFGKKSCWRHMSTLEAVVMKCKKKEEMMWILATIEDLLLRGEASNSQFSSRSLKGGKTGGGSRGLMDEWLAKRNILLWLFADFGTHGLPSEMCMSLSKIFETHTNVREKLLVGMIGLAGVFMHACSIFETNNVPPS